MLLRAIAGVVLHYRGGDFSGAVKTAGFDSLETAPHEIARHTAFVEEDIESQIVYDIVEDEILFSLENFSVPREIIEERIALALLPKVLILDNPCAELDPTSAENLYNLLSKLNAQSVTIVTADQKVEILCRRAENLIVMKEGGIISSGRTQAVMNNTAALEDAGIILPKTALLGRDLSREGLYSGDIPIFPAL